MINVRFKLSILVSIVLLLSCNGNGQLTVDDAVRKLSGKRIRLGWDSLVLTPSGNTDLDKIKRTPFKIVSLFDEDSCTTCFIGHLEACKKYYNTLPKDSVCYICVVPIESGIMQLALQYYDTEGLTLISDKGNHYVRENRIEKFHG